MFIVSAQLTLFGTFDDCVASVFATQLAEQVPRFILEAAQVSVTAIDEFIGTGQAPAEAGWRQQWCANCKGAIPATA